MCVGGVGLHFILWIADLTEGSKSTGAVKSHQSNSTVGPRFLLQLFPATRAASQKTIKQGACCTVGSANSAWHGHDGTRSALHAAGSDSKRKTCFNR